MVCFWSAHDYKFFQNAEAIHDHLNIIIQSYQSKKEVATQQTFLVLQYVLKTSWRRLQRNNFSSSKTSSRRVFKTPSQDVFKKSSRRVCKTSSLRRLEDILKTSWKTKKCDAEDVFNTSSTLLHQDECLLGRKVNLMAISEFRFLYFDVSPADIY